MAIEPPPAVPSNPANPEPGKSPAAVPSGKLPANVPAPGSTSERSLAPTVDELGDGAAVTISFWQHPFVQNVLPFLTSFALHAGVILIIVLAYETVVVIKQVVKDQIIIPDATIIEGAEVGGIPNPGLGGDPNREARQDKDPNVPDTSEGWAEKKSASLSTSLMGGGASDSTSDGLIGVGSGGGFGSGKGVGSGIGKGVGSGTGDGSGMLAPFGVPGGGGGIGPKSPFMGVSGNARLVSYVCDASGSMMNKFDGLRMEIRKAVDVLKPIQSFSIIFFQEDKEAALAPQLVVANPANKRKAFDFLDRVSAHGATDPIPGLRLAFQQKPQLVYLLTDGDFPDNDKVLEFIRQNNKDKAVKINTIAFMDRGEAYEKVLQTIASENGGTFKYVSEQDLGR